MAQTAGITLYETLGVEPTASQDEIRRAYRKLLRTAHPDSGGTVGMFRSIQHAYEVLSDPTQRSQYDAGPPHPPFSDPGPPAGHSTSDGESSNSKESSSQEPSADSEQSTTFRLRLIRASRNPLSSLRNIPRNETRRHRPGQRSGHGCSGALVSFSQLSNWWGCSRRSPSGTVPVGIPARSSAISCRA